MRYMWYNIINWVGDSLFPDIVGSSFLLIPSVQRDEKGTKCLEH